jgi:hypothetical protein
MTQPRERLTISDAITRIVGLLHASRAAEIVDRSETTIYNWINPVHEATPNLTQALALDAAYRAAGGDGAPIHEAYAFQLDLAVVDQSASQLELSIDIGEVARECGDAIASGIVITQPGADPSLVHHALVQANEAQSAVAKMIGRLKGFLPRDTVSRGEMSGELHK